jgi:subtilisin
MVAIDPNSKKYIVRFKLKDQRQNKSDDKVEIFRAILGIADTSNILDVTKESEKVKHSVVKNTVLNKDLQTISDINTYQLPLVMARLTEEQYHKIRKDPNVLYVEKEKFHSISVETIPWGVTRVKAAKTDMEAIPTKHRGDGVKVGVIDTGIDYNHVDLKPNIKGGACFVNGLTDFIDQQGHGTHVSGTIAATETSSAGVTGVAPQVWLYGLRVFGPTGQASNADILEAVEWARINKMHVTNNSYGNYMFSQTEADAFKALYDTGCNIVAAAGNEAIKNDKGHYPSNYPNVISISAFNDQDQMADFSNGGPNIKFGAPGVAIQSTWLNNTQNTINGTSMSCPHVVGIVSLASANYRINPSNTTTYNPTFNKQTHLAGNDPDCRYSRTICSRTKR